MPTRSQYLLSLNVVAFFTVAATVGVVGVQTPQNFGYGCLTPQLLAAPGNNTIVFDRNMRFSKHFVVILEYNTPCTIHLIKSVKVVASGRTLDGIMLKTVLIL